MAKFVIWYIKQTIWLPHYIKVSFPFNFKACMLGFANPTVFSRLWFGFASDWQTGDITGVTAVKPITSPDRQPAYSLLPNCFSCARASSAVCTEHQKVTENIRNHHQLIASCIQKRTEIESQSFQCHIHWSLIWQNYNSLSLSLQEKAWVCYFLQNFKSKKFH